MFSNSNIVHDDVHPVKMSDSDDDIHPVEMSDSDDDIHPVEMSDSDDDETSETDIFDKLTGKTLRKCVNYQPYMDIMIRNYRTFNKEECKIPITDADKYITFTNILNSIGNSYDVKPLSLGKHGLFSSNFLMALNLYCTSETNVYNKYSGSSTYTFILPATSYITISPLKKNFYDPIACQSSIQPRKPHNCEPRHRKPRYWKYYMESTLKYININGKKYSIDNNYMRDGINFIPIFTKSISEQNIYEQIIKCKQSFNTSVNIKFMGDTLLSGLIIKPEPMKFEMIYEDVNERNRHRRHQNNNYIKCLSNQPGFITSFKLQYRSSKTGNMWIELGIFAGNKSFNDETKIYFSDTLIAADIRIIPLSRVLSIRKIVIMPFTTNISKTEDTLDTVKYMITVPHIKYNAYNSYKPDVNCNGKYENNYRTDKGKKKEMRRYLSEACDY